MGLTEDLSERVKPGDQGGSTAAQKLHSPPEGPLDAERDLYGFIAESLRSELGADAPRRFVPRNKQTTHAPGAEIPSALPETPVDASNESPLPTTSNIDRLIERLSSETNIT